MKKQKRIERHLQKALNHTNKTMLRLSQLKADGVDAVPSLVLIGHVFTNILDLADERGIKLDTGGMPA